MLNFVYNDLEIKKLKVNFVKCEINQIFSNILIFVNTAEHRNLNELYSELVLFEKNAAVEPR
jgi:hypothetical protein